MYIYQRNRDTKILSDVDDQDGGMLIQNGGFPCRDVNPIKAWLAMGEFKGGGGGGFGVFYRKKEGAPGAIGETRL